jgi:hypothetical protein
MATLLEDALTVNSERDLVELLHYALATVRVAPPRPVTRGQVAAWYDAIQLDGTSLADRVAPYARELR